MKLAVNLPLAIWMDGPPSGLRTAVRVLVTLPMVLPPVVGGVALLFAFGRNGLVGAPLADWFGVSLPFTEAGVVLAEAYIALPFFVLGRLTGVRTVYIEVFDRIDSSTLTGRLCRPFTDLMLVQWPEQADLYRGAVVVGPLL